MMKGTKLGDWWHRHRALIVATLVIGVVVGISSALLSGFLDLVEELFLHFHESNRMPVNVNVTGIRRFLSLLLGGLFATLSWYWLQKKGYRPVGLTTAVAGKRLPLGHTLIHVLTQIFFVGTGGSIGRELAPREAGAAWAQAWIKRMQGVGWTLEADDRRLLVAAAAGAGFAGVYIAPFTGALFCLELLYQKMTPRAITVSLTMSTIATLIGATVKGFSPYYLVGARDFSLLTLPFAVLVAPLMGALGALFGRAIKFSAAHRPHDRRLLVTFPLVGLLTGLVAASYPQIMGNGRGIAQLAINAGRGQALVWALAFGAIAKPVVTLLTIRCGGYGGVLTPSISVGASLGVLIGLAYTSLVPGIPLSQCALIGAVAFLAASQTAPLMALMMLFEVCHLASSALLPMAVAVTLATAVNRFIRQL